MSGRKITTMSGRVVDVPNFKKRTSARKPWPPSGSVLASKVSRLEKQVKLQEGEWKYLDVTQASTASVSAGALTLLTGCATGDGPSNREGTQIYVKSIQVRTRIEFNAGDATAGAIRMVLVQDKQSNGAAPNVSDIYSIPVLNAIDALRNLNGRKRFKILSDNTWIVSQNGTPGYEYDIYLKKPITVQYNAGNTGTVADIATNALYLLICSDQAANGPYVAFYSRVRYTE